MDSSSVIVFVAVSAIVFLLLGFTSFTNFFGSLYSSSVPNPNYPVTIVPVDCSSSQPTGNSDIRDGDCVTFHATYTGSPLKDGPNFRSSNLIYVDDKVYSIVPDQVCEGPLGSTTGCSLLFTNSWISSNTWGDFSLSKSWVSKGMTAGSHYAEGLLTGISNNNVFLIPFKLSFTVAPNPCVLNGGDQLVVETFASGTTVTKGSLRYPPRSITPFCDIHPAIITDQSTLTTYTDASMYQALNDGGSITVPSGKTYSFFYVTSATSSLPVVCNPTQAFNQAEGKCVDTIGFTTVCSEGSFDPSKGVCVTQSVTICPSGYRLDTSLGACVNNPPSIKTCTQGTYDATQDKCIITPTTGTNCLQGTYDPVSGQCIVTPPINATCAQGTYNPSTQQCVITPTTTNNCLQGAYNSTTGTCTINPQQNYQCSKGTLTTNPDGSKTCTITLSDVYTCSTGFTYNTASKRCESSTPPSSVISCPSGSNWDGVQLACVSTAPVTPSAPLVTTQPIVTQPSGGLSTNIKIVIALLVGILAVGINRRYNLL